MNEEPNRVLLYPVDAEFSAQFLTLPVILFALPIVCTTAIVWAMWQCLRVAYLSCYLAASVVKKIITQKNQTNTLPR